MSEANKVAVIRKILVVWRMGLALVQNLVRADLSQNVLIALDPENDTALHGHADFPLVYPTSHLVEPQGRVSRVL